MMRPQSGQLRVNAQQRLAARIANVVLPKRAGSIFPKLLARQVAKYGNNFGNATPPAPEYLAEVIGHAPVSASMQQRQMSNVFDTRADIIRQQAGGSPLSVTQMAPRPGQATPRGAEQSFAPQSMSPRLSATAMPASGDGNPMIDDSGWPVTLNQILGSRTLTAEQLQSASYQNAYSMIQAGTGMTEQLHQEAAYMLQRMILEGYIRGVDLVRDIKMESGGKVPLSFETLGGSTIGWGGGGGVRLDIGYWQSAGDAGRMTLFYHEFGHELLDKPGVQEHTSGGIMNPVLMTGSQMLSNYTGYMDSFFNLANSSRFTPTASGLDTQALLKQHPDWFPSLNGNITPNAGPNGGPGPITNNISLPPAPVMPPMGNITDIGSNDAGPVPNPTSEAKTPVAGVLPDMSQLYSFSAGLAAQQGRQSPSLQGMAGALAKFQSG